jgi:hypothetical protein
MLKSSHHPRWLLVLVCVAVLVLLTPAAALAAGGRAQPASAAMRVIPVWAFLNDGSPVAGAQVVIIAGGKRVGQLHARTSGVTNVNGVALVLVRRVPRRYTVVVRGGRVAGQRLPGSLRSLAVSGVGVVDVNPLTSVVSQLHRQHRSLRFGRASRLVKRYFGVPRWADLGDDLRDGPYWFSARAYVAEARRYGSTDRLNRALARRILHAGSRFSQISDEAQLHSAFGATGSISAADKTKPSVPAHLFGGKLAVTVFGYLLETAVGIKAQEGVGYLLGRLLKLASEHGIDIPADKSELEQVQEQLDAIGAQLTELKGQVSRVELGIANSDASRLLHSSDVLIANIDYASDLLAVLAASNLNEKGRKGLVDDITYHIHQHLLSAPGYFRQLLDPTFSIANNPIKAVSHALGTSGFFDVRTSNQVRDVYNYYKNYQLEVAVLLKNYWTTKPDTYTDAYQDEEIAKIKADTIKIERESLKPNVPAGTFIDTRTPAFMWAPATFTEDGSTVLAEHHQTRTNLTIGGFHNYQMPSFHDFKNLLRGATGDRRAWLQRQVEVPLNQRLVWGSEGIRVKQHITAPGARVYTPYCTLSVDIFDLDKDEVESPEEIERNGECSSLVLTNPDFRQRLGRSGGLLLLRYLAPGESYYW